VDIDEKLPLVIMDKERIKEAIIGLINNSIRYTSIGSITVKTELSADKNFVKVSVIDTGIEDSQEKDTKII